MFNIFSRVSIPKGAVAVRPFDLERYLGLWYEIARMDFRFERGLSRVTARYSLAGKGVIRVENRGYDEGRDKWKESIGKAKAAGDPSEARLKVSFFGPFYSGYNVLALDPDYRYALVAGNDTRYLWLLSREPAMPAAVRERYLEMARGLGYDTERLVWTKQR